jgi:ribosome-binding protein aMBF1 (putative translation factor)
MDRQDWTPVILRSSKTAVKPATGPKEPKEEKSKTLTAESRQGIALTRVAKNLTQKELDQKGQFPAGSCNAWEAGRLCPTGPQINLLQRLLGIKLVRV